MKTTHAVTEAISPMAKKAMYLSHFTPSMMPPETLQAMLVQRGPLLKRTVASVVHSVETAAKHHHLFVGPRGIGKTHLISLIHHQISQNPAVQSKALIAWMREEEWGVTSFMELILRILRTLDQTYPELGIDAQTQALYELSIPQAEEQATQILLQTMGGKTLVILLENLDDLFDQLKPTSQKQLRALIQNHPQFVLVATTPSLFTAVTSQNSPFYGFFDIDPLEELSFEEVVELLEKIALERGDTGLATFIQSTEGRARIRAVHHLAEGNPRIYIIFAQFLTQEALDELVQAFMHTLDELTPYYQARMKELSGQQRKIVEYLVHYRGAATVKQIAKSCFITQQVCSGQLKQLREKRTVRSIERGRESYYELAEPLMRLCMEVKQQKGEPIGLFVEMLRIWYTEKELESWLDVPDEELAFERKYLEAALALLKKQEIEPSVNAILKDLKKAAPASQTISLLIDLAKLNTKNGGVKRLQSIVRLVYPDRCEVENLAGKDFESLAGDVLALFRLIPMPNSSDNKRNAEGMLLTFLGASSTLHHHSPECAIPLFKVLGESMDIYKMVGVRAIFKAMIMWPNANSDWLNSLLLSLPNGELSKESMSILKRLTRIFRALSGAVQTHGDAELLKLPKEERRLVEEILPMYRSAINSNA
jgi:DNA polymerase III delta prime subunit